MDCSSRAELDCDLNQAVNEELSNEVNGEDHDDGRKIKAAEAYRQPPPDAIEHGLGCGI